VKMGEDKLKAVFSFNYLGMSNTVDADPAYPIEVRLAKAAGRFSELHKIWRSETLNLKVKLQLFESGVCSMATHVPDPWPWVFGPKRELLVHDDIVLPVIILLLGKWPRPRN